MLCMSLLCIYTCLALSTLWPTTETQSYDALYNVSTSWLPISVLMLWHVGNEERERFTLKWSAKTWRNSATMHRTMTHTVGSSRKCTERACHAEVYTLTIPYSNVEWVDCSAWQLQHKLDSRLKSITTVDTAKIWVKMKPILGVIEWSFLSQGLKMTTKLSS